jgi:single-stranded-DNA-specific exonuclease
MRLHLCFANGPKRETSTGCELAGVGVAFYLVRALQNEFAAKFPAGQEKWLMDLVALGTICDVVPLVKDNRILAAFGLKVLNKTRNKGIRALANTAGINQEEIGVYQTGFLLGPRLNAAGRLETAQAAIELLLTKEKAEAAKMAGKLTELNKQRQELTAKIVEEAKEQIKKFDQNKKIFLVSKKGWPHGIVGIVASRLTEEYSRPVLVMEEGTEVLKGSARSIKNFDIVAAIGQCHSLLNRFGGHRFAAGFELKKENLSLFQEMLEEIAGREISAEDMIPQVDIDTEITMDKVDLDLLDQLKRLEPHGMGNPRPVFTLRGVRINACRLVGSPSVHLKMAVEQNDKLLMGMSFNHGENINFDINKKMDLAVTLNENIWKNKRNVEFLLVDAKQI